MDRNRAPDNLAAILAYAFVSYDREQAGTSPVHATIVHVAADPVGRVGAGPVAGAPRVATPPRAKLVRRTFHVRLPGFAREFFAAMFANKAKRFDPFGVIRALNLRGGECVRWSPAPAPRIAALVVVGHGAVSEVPLTPAGTATEPRRLGTIGLDAERCAAYLADLADPGGWLLGPGSPAGARAESLRLRIRMERRAAMAADCGHLQSSTHTLSIPQFSGIGTTGIANKPRALPLFGQEVAD